MNKRIVLVTNEINPYRKSFYDKLHDYCKSTGVSFTVLLMTKVEHGYNWDYEKVKTDYAILMKGVHFSFPINNYINIEVVKQMRKLKPDIVIMAGSYFYYTNWLVLAFKSILKYPVYFWSETHLQELRNYSSWKFKVREFFRNIIYKRFNGFWYSGKLSKDLILKYANSDAKYHFVPNLIDYKTYYNQTQQNRMNRRTLREKWNISDGNIVLITPARLSWVKGLHTFVDLLTETENPKKLTMLVPGIGPDREIIEEKIKESNIDVRLLGYQEQNVIIELYSLADYFVMPSLSDPNPLTCIEALWSGLPLLVSKHVGNYPEAIDYGKNGYVFDYSKPKEAVTIINKLMNASDEWKRQAGERSLQIASEYYHPDKVVHRLIDDMLKDIK